MGLFTSGQKAMADNVYVKVRKYLKPKDGKNTYTSGAGFESENKALRNTLLMMS